MNSTFQHGTDETVADSELLVQEDTSTSWLQLSDQELFLLVYPQSHRFRAKDDIPVSWRPIGDPIRGAWQPGLEDEMFIRELLKQLQKDFNVNPRQMYSLGYSNGGLFLAGLLLESDNFRNIFAAVCNYMGGIDPEQLKHAGLDPEKVSQYCDEPCVSLIGIGAAGTSESATSKTCREVSPQYQCIYTAKDDSGFIQVAASEMPPHVQKDQFAPLQSIFRHSLPFTVSYCKPQASSLTQPSVASESCQYYCCSYSNLVSGKPPMYIVTGSQDTNRNYCYTALCAFKELNYNVFFDDLLHKPHEYQSQSTVDIWHFFKMHTCTD